MAETEKKVLKEWDVQKIWEEVTSKGKNTAEGAAEQDKQDGLPEKIARITARMQEMYDIGLQVCKEDIGPLYASEVLIGMMNVLFSRNLQIGINTATSEQMAEFRENVRCMIDILASLRTVRPI